MIHTLIFHANRFWCRRANSRLMGGYLTSNFDQCNFPVRAFYVLLLAGRNARSIHSKRVACVTGDMLLLIFAFVSHKSVWFWCASVFALFIYKFMFDACFVFVCVCVKRSKSKRIFWSTYILIHFDTEYRFICNSVSHAVAEIAATWSFTFWTLHFRFSKIISAHRELDFEVKKKKMVILDEFKVSFIQNFFFVECMCNVAASLSGIVPLFFQHVSLKREEKVFCKWQQMQVYVWRVSHQQQQQRQRSSYEQQQKQKKNRFHIVCAHWATPTGSCRFGHPRLFNYSPKMLSNKWRRNCRWTAFSVHPCADRHLIECATKYIRAMAFTGEIY